jgi:hypothetical protein
VSLKEKLEDECQSFLALAQAGGLSRKDAMRTTAALDFRRQIDVGGVG